MWATKNHYFVGVEGSSTAVGGCRSRVPTTWAEESRYPLCWIQIFCELSIVSLFFLCCVRAKLSGNIYNPLLFRGARKGYLVVLFPNSFVVSWILTRVKYLIDFVTPRMWPHFFEDSIFETRADKV